MDVGDRVRYYGDPRGTFWGVVVSQGKIKGTVYVQWDAPPEQLVHEGFLVTEAQHQKSQDAPRKAGASRKRPR